jgi:hypothetical protein
MDSAIDPACRCGYLGPHAITQGRPPHGNQVNCGGCAVFLRYLRKPKNSGKRPSNKKHRAYWLERMRGVLRCALCGAPENEGYPLAFDIDHIWQVEDGGPEEEQRNTMPLCGDCHQIKNAVRARRLHSIGRSARDGLRTAATDTAA